MFEYKTLEEVSKMTLAEQQSYMTAKEKHEAELRKNEIDKAIEEAKKDNVSKEEIEKLTEKQADIIKEIERVSLEIKAQGEKSNNDARVLGFDGALKGAIEENVDFKAIANGAKQSSPIVIEMKAAVTMGMNTTVEAAGSESQISITRDSGIISVLRKRILKYLGAGVSVGSLAGDNKVMWIEELDEQGNPIFIAEGADKTEISVRYEERDKKARKIGVYGKVTTEMMRNLPSLINYIKNNLMRRVDITTEDQLFSGDDTGDNLAGLTEYASAFTGGSLNGIVPDPTVADVFRAIALQVEEAFGIATAVFVRPSVLAQMDIEKSDDGVYLLPPFRAANGNVVAGMKLISTNGMPTGLDFIGGDLSVVNVLFSDNMSIQIGMDGNDFTKNKKTILVEQELVQFVSANDTQVLVQGNIDDAITALTV